MDNWYSLTHNIVETYYLIILLAATQAQQLRTPPMDSQLFTLVFIPFSNVTNMVWLLELCVPMRFRFVNQIHRLYRLMRIHSIKFHHYTSNSII